MTKWQRFKYDFRFLIAQLLLAVITYLVADDMDVAGIYALRDVNDAFGRCM